MKNSFNNANMWQKSMIQQILEHNAVLDSFKKTLESLSSQYNINDNVFGIIHGLPSEIHNGYFVIEHECEDLQSAIKEMNGDLTKCIRIVENNKYQVGSWNKSILECATDKTIIDIENQIQLER